LKNSSLLLIDGMNYLYNSDFGNGIYLGGKRVSGVLNFLRKLRKVIKSNLKSHIIVCWDSRSEKRKKIFSDYKKGRKKNRLYYEMLDQSDLLDDVLFLLGIQTCHVDGLEADDIIGSFAFSFDGNVKIYSQDSDLFQLVNDKVTVISKNVKITKENFEAITDIPHDFFILFKAVVGDSGDNIPGIVGIGEKTFKKILKYSDYDIEKFLNHEKIRSHFDILERNMSLIQLDPIKIPCEITKLSVDKEKFRAWCYKMKFVSILKDFSNFIGPFRMRGMS